MAGLLIGDPEMHRLGVADQQPHLAPAACGRGEKLPVTIADHTGEREVEQIDALARLGEKLSPVQVITTVGEHLQDLPGPVQRGRLGVRRLPGPQQLLADPERVGDPPAVTRAWGAAAQPPARGLDVHLRLDDEVVDLETGVPEGLPELLVSQRVLPHRSCALTAGNSREFARASLCVP
jgi:hypothetical protein